jgi:hypothetical protein
MSLLSELINKVEDEAERERLQERIALIQHKIKFMDKVPVACLDTENKFVADLEDLVNSVGGVLQHDPVNARVLIYWEPGIGLLQLMGAVPAMLKKEWPSVEYSRVYLWDDEAVVTERADLAVEALEDLAEMLYPGYFVFGNEGKTWISFKTQ